jgi:hypothetical protein
VALPLHDVARELIEMHDQIKRLYQIRLDEVAHCPDEPEAVALAKICRAFNASFWQRVAEVAETLKETPSDA